MLPGGEAPLDAQRHALQRDDIGQDGVAHDVPAHQAAGLILQQYSRLAARCVHNRLTRTQTAKQSINSS